MTYTITEESFPPLLTTPEVVYDRDRYLVYSPSGWKHYAAKIKAPPRKIDPNLSYIKFTQAPKVFEQGFYAFRSKFYPVSLRDLVRGQFNVRKNHGLTADQLQNLYSEQTPGTPQEQPGPVPVTGDEDQSINLAREEYLRTLLFLENPEEEWNF